MPPSKKRPRSYDHAKIRAAVLAQFDAVREAVLALDEERLARPTHLGDWTVRELAVHLGMATRAVSRSLAQPAPECAELALVDWPLATLDVVGTVADVTRQLAKETEDLEAYYADIASRLEEQLAVEPDTRIVATRLGAMTLGDFLVTRTIELIVHTDDLNRAAGIEVPFERQALAACTRLLADTLARKAPGASTEVRIPPYAVVQCVEGPRHTRGTPPNVVETDPLTWVRLATGRADWATALDEAKVSASGERADLSALLPLLS
ncbi:sterol carrier family protein [Streptomyces sp. NPDC002851]